MPSPGGYPGVGIDTRGIKDLVRDLRRLDRRLALAFTAELRDIGNEVRDKVRTSTQRPFRTGALRRSVKTSVRGAQVSLYSTLPQSGVWEWGGTIRPRGSPIVIPETEFVRREIVAGARGVEERMGEILDQAASRYAQFH